MPLRFDFASITRLLQRQFQSRRAGVLCLVLALANKLINAVYFTSLSGDKALYLLFAQSWVQGHGPLEPVHYAGAAATRYFFNNAMYTPLYTVLALPVLALTRSPLTTAIAIDVLAWASLLLALRKLANLVFGERWIANFFLLCFGLFLFLFEFGSGPKDTLATGFLLWSVVTLYRLQNGNATPRRAAVLFVSLLALGLTKLLYVPLIPLFLAIWFFSGGPRNRTYSLVALFGLSVIAAGFIWWISAQKQQHGGVQLFAHDAASPGFYPVNLQATYPFITSSLINTNFWGVQLSSIFRQPFASIVRAFQFADLFFGLLLLAGVRRLTKEQVVPKPLLRLVLLTAGAVLLLVAAASVRLSPLVSSRTHAWTFVQDARSFLFPMIVVQVVLFAFLFRSRFLDPGLRRFLLLLFLIECGHGLYFTAKQPGQTINETPTLDALEHKRRELEGIQGRSVALVTSDEFLYRQGRLSGMDMRIYSPHAAVFHSDTTVYFSVSHSADSLLLKPLMRGKTVLPLDGDLPYSLHLIK